MKTLTTERWRQLAPMLDEVLEHDVAARPECIARLAGDDEALRDHLEALVAAYERPSSVLDGTLFDGGIDHRAAPSEIAAAARPAARDSASSDEIEDERVGTMIGGYRLVERLGQGGMATVYRAVRQEDDFDHEVAIKLVRVGTSSPALRDRFRAEQGILAALDHPNIARLYDGGVTEDGQPYIVMECIGGEAIDAYADRLRLGIAERLALFATVCQAIEHAHAKLIVHRDLKPSNIMVKFDGTVKVLDFGIAKLLDTHELESESPSTLTSLYGTPLTPEYAAPEQLAGEVVTTAADIYALGTVLYDLLAGSRPFDLASLRPHERIQKVFEREPDRPSTRVGVTDVVARRRGTQTRAAEVARNRGTTVRRLRRRLSGDLDTIVTCAIRREAERRYISVAALREDIERHLGHLPIRARPESWTYALGRFVTRHRWGVAIGCLVALALVTALGFALQGQAAARREAATSTRIADFLVDAFQAGDPGLGQDGTVSARDLLTQAAERIRIDLADEPEIHARLATVLAEASLNLGAYEQAERLASEGVRLWSTSRGADAERTLAARNLEALVLSYRGRLDDAESRFRSLLESVSDRFPDSELEATVANDLGMLLVERRQLEEAETLYQRSLEIHQARGNARGQEAVRTRNNLAMARRVAGDHDAAADMLREVLVLQRETLSEPHVDIATALNNLAAAVRRQGDLEQAATLYREALDQRRAVLGDRHPDVAQSLNNVGSIAYRMGDIDGAFDHMSRAVEIWQQAYDGDHPRLADGLTNLGSLARRRGDLDAALDRYTDALAMHERLRGTEHVQVAAATKRLGATLAEADRAAEGVPLLERSLAIYARANGLSNRQTVDAAIDLLSAYRVAKRETAANALVERLRLALVEDEALATIFEEAVAPSP